MSAHAIELDSVRKSFGKNEVLRDVSLKVAKGESIGIIGGSGTGKSVLIKCVVGLLLPDGGSIRVFGDEVTRSSPLTSKCKIGMLFQGSALFDSMPVWQNVAFQLIRGPEKTNRKAAKEIAIEKLERVGLDSSVADLFPADLSGGMQKRAGLARALVANPEILFFDEPTTGLDPLKAGLIDDLIRSIVSETRATAVTITHDMDSVRAVCDTLAMLDDGLIEWTGPVAEIDTARNSSLRRFVEGRTSTTQNR